MGCMLYIFSVGIAIYNKPRSEYPGKYFPRNSFVTDGTPIMGGNSRYPINCHSSGAGKVYWYYRNGTKTPSSGHSYTSNYNTEYKFNQLTRIISRNPSNKEFYCQGNQRIAWFGMFVNPS